MRKKLTIGLFGFGCVGSGLYEILNRSGLFNAEIKTIVVKNKNKDRQKVNWVIEQVNACGGIDYAAQKMNDYKQKALELLAEFPDNEARAGLRDLVLYVTDRKY